MGAAPARAREGLVGPDGRILLMNTGTGLKYSSVFPEAAGTAVEAGQELPAVAEPPQGAR